MKTLHKIMLACSLFAGAASAVQAAVTVQFVNPENFEDVALSPRDRDDILRDFERHFAKLGQRLPPGQDLSVEVLDIDLAGRLQPSRAAMQDIRVLRGGADWPRMHLRYTLTSNGQVLRSGDVQLRNQMYLDRLPNYLSGDNLRYEKQMIDDWFYKEFNLSRTRRR
jgi:hypothetical protein